jgi:exodeoxyribonuclease-3
LVGLLVGGWVDVGSLIADPGVIRVMTFNLWQGGEGGGQSLDQSVRVITRAGADIVGLQETRGEAGHGEGPDEAQTIARRLAWQYVDQGEGTGVISRYEIAGQSPGKWGVRINLPARRHVWLFNVHFAHAPYQPYQLLGIPYEDAALINGADRAIEEARRARGHQVAAMLADVKALDDPGEAIFITGDFNEPSVQDWTPAVCRAGACPVAVAWPTTAAVFKAGFVDAYRQSHPDPVQSPGYTWTPVTAEDDPRDRHDRIDFVFARGDQLRVQRTQIVGERPERADVVVIPYPSDHRAVVATVTVE